jgi:hypothetical protein
MRRKGTDLTCCMYVGYRIAQDQKALLSYSFDRTAHATRPRVHDARQGSNLDPRYLLGTIP